MSKTWEVQMTYHFKMESENEDGPTKEERTEQIKKNLPNANPEDFEFEYMEEQG